MKLGIVGSGKIVQEFLPWLVQAPTVEVAALCSTERSAEKAAALCRQYGVPLHVTDYGRLLEAVDTVYIALPNLLHTAYAKAALEAGRNAIVEKPLAPCAAEAARLAALARSKGLYLFEAGHHPIPAELPQIAGAAAPGGPGQGGAVQLLPVFQPVRRIPGRADRPCIRPEPGGGRPDGPGGLQRQLHRGPVWGTPAGALCRQRRKGRRYQRHPHHGLQLLQGGQHCRQGTAPHPPAI